MNYITAFSPAALGLIFKVCPNRNPLRMGSVGIGFTVDSGVIVKVKNREATNIKYNGRKIIFPTVLGVKESLTEEPVEIDIESQLPLGFGFGISGASALACALAINKLFSLQKPRRELVALAHRAEIENKTGLGTVGTLSIGGFLRKTSPGLPVGARSYPFEGRDIHAIIIERLLTPVILADQGRIEKINRAADLGFERIDKLSSPKLADFLDIASSFVSDCGLLENLEVEKIINDIQKIGGHATMAILGNVVISDILPREKCNYEIRNLKITKSRAHIQL